MDQSWGTSSSTLLPLYTEALFTNSGHCGFSLKNHPPDGLPTVGPIIHGELEEDSVLDKNWLPFWKAGKIFPA